MTENLNPARLKMGQWIEENQVRTGVSDELLAAALDYGNPRVITMMKTGTMRIPLNKALPLARALGVEPGEVMYRLLDEIEPGVRQAVEDCVGALCLSEGEKRLIQAVRRAGPGKEPVPIMFDPDSIITLVVARDA